MKGSGNRLYSREKLDMLYDAGYREMPYDDETLKKQGLAGVIQRGN